MLSFRTGNVISELYFCESGVERDVGDVIRKSGTPLVEGSYSCGVNGSFYGVSLELKDGTLLLIPPSSLQFFTRSRENR